MTKKPQVLLLNGPPQAGKDTLGAYIAELSGAREVKFAGALKWATHAMYAFLKPSRAVPACNKYEGPVKDQGLSFFLGNTPRESYIAVSELLMKEKHGQDIFGRLLRDDIKLGRRRVVVTDSGFAAESSVLIEEFGVDNVALVHLRRKGHTFQGDSRGYIDLPCSTFDIPNHAGLLDLRDHAVWLLEQLNNKGWGWPIQLNQQR